MRQRERLEFVSEVQTNMIAYATKRRTSRRRRNFKKRTVIIY
jgi:hypothetical protein